MSSSARTTSINSWLSKDDDALAQMSKAEYRTLYNKEHAEFLKGRKNEHIVAIIDELYRPLSVDMKELKRLSAKKVSERIEHLYANYGGFLDPSTNYVPGMIGTWGKDYALNARGIYYRHNFSPEWVTSNRKVWIPSLEGIDWDSPEERHQRDLARKVQMHSIRNERRRSSEYAWEADAWSDVFGRLRDDICFDLDKSEALIEIPKTSEVKFTLTGKKSLEKRIPDLTLSLATFQEGDRLQPIFMEELLQDSLIKLLVHPKCGLIADPKASGEIDRAFPFALYEAKGWSGDCREARHQVTTAAASHLDMLDNLARTPGPIMTKSARKYQTTTSHQYQVFCLTQFGAYWHILVAYRRPRQPEEHAGARGMSETVYVFQRIWSGRVIDERTAWELLTLIDQIHLWAKTEFRTFVVDHLKPWHKFCKENYLLDWNSVFDCPPERKRKREINDDGDLNLPGWTSLATDAHRRKLQVVAKNSLEKAEREQRLLKGKAKADNQQHQKYRYLACVAGDCGDLGLFSFTSVDDYMEHQRSFCHFPESHLEELRPKIVEFFELGMESQLMREKNVLSLSELEQMQVTEES